MKYILIFCLTISTNLYAQNGGVRTGGSGGTLPVDDTRTLLEYIRNRNNVPKPDTVNSWTGGTIGPRPVNDSLLNTNNTGGGFGGYGGDPRKLDLTPGDLNAGSVATGGDGFSGGNVGPKPSTNSATNSDLGALEGQVTQDQIRAFKTEVDAFNARTANKGDEEVLPTRLHIESINLSSDEVTEITLKDGSVVMVEDLQEFVRQKMKEKLNQ